MRICEAHDARDGSRRAPSDRTLFTLQDCDVGTSPDDQVVGNGGSDDACTDHDDIDGFACHGSRLPNRIPIISLRCRYSEPYSTIVWLCSRMYESR